MSYDVEQNVARDRDRQYRVEHGKINEHQRHADDENGNPPQHVFDEMPGGNLSVERLTSVQSPRGHAVDDHSDEREKKHSGSIGLLWLE